MFQTCEKMFLSKKIVSTLAHLMIEDNEKLKKQKRLTFFSKVLFSFYYKQASGALKLNNRSIIQHHKRNEKWFAGSNFVPFDTDWSNPFKRKYISIFIFIKRYFEFKVSVHMNDMSILMI